MAEDIVVVVRTTTTTSPASDDDGTLLLLRIILLLLLSCRYPLPLSVGAGRLIKNVDLRCMKRVNQSKPSSTSTREVIVR